MIVLAFSVNRILKVFVKGKRHLKVFLYNLFAKQISVLAVINLRAYCHILTLIASGRSCPETNQQTNKCSSNCRDWHYNRSFVRHIEELVVLLCIFF